MSSGNPTEHKVNRCVTYALDIYRYALQEVRADILVRKALSSHNNDSKLQSLLEDISQYRTIRLIGAGKAACAMAEPLIQMLGDRISEAVVITKYGHGRQIPGLRVLEAGHPIPDEASLRAGEEVSRIAGSCGENDLLICLISGGSSALMELPEAGLTLDDLQKTTKLLLQAGAEIDEVNAVRSRISQIKAGGLAYMAHPAKVVCLVLSDVLGDPPQTIGSGPCHTSHEKNIDIIKMLERFRLTELLPPIVLSKCIQRTGKEDREIPNVSTAIVGNINSALDAASKRARELGSNPLVLSENLNGEAREAGRTLGGIARRLPKLYEENGVNCLLLGGETTVSVHGAGKGGRCQEIVAAAAMHLNGIPGVVLLAGGTDGTDGPTDAAGAFTDASTIIRAGSFPAAALANSDVYPWLEKAEALIKTGPTDSNVGDLVIMLYIADEKNSDKSN